MVGNLVGLDAQTVEIPDAELVTAIRIAFEKPMGEITVEDMDGLTELDAGNSTRGCVCFDTVPGPPSPIRSLEGLPFARDLGALNLSGKGVGVGTGPRSFLFKT